MMLRYLTIAAGAILLISTLPAEAQNAFRLGHGAQKIDPSDYEPMGRAARSLYETDDLRQGTTAGWANDKTGNTGTITLVGPKTYQDMPCRTLRYVNSFKGSTATRTYVADWCKTAGGEWKMR